MRLALISDIHGNLVALEAVLAEIAQQNIAHDSQHILCLGDVAAFGPQPLQVLARLQTIGCPVVMGNTDTEDDLEQAFAGHRAYIMIGEHTHIQMFRRHKDVLVLNPGSVGYGWPYK
jgi:predicted phosphodiesterase